jgi:hypothetical protein
MGGLISREPLDAEQPDGVAQSRASRVLIGCGHGNTWVSPQGLEVKPISGVNVPF